MDAFAVSGKKLNKNILYVEMTFINVVSEFALKLLLEAIKTNLSTLFIPTVGPFEFQKQISTKMHKMQFSQL